jgi:hypothetical protein
MADRAHRVGIDPLWMAEKFSQPFEISRLFEVSFEELAYRVCPVTWLFDRFDVRARPTSCR